jgi:hypothetical protein
LAEAYDPYAHRFWATGHSLHFSLSGLRKANIVFANVLEAPEGEMAA